MSSLPLLAAIYVVQDWYRFVMYAEVSPLSEVHLMDGYWRWADFQKMMPGSLQAWGCAHLMARQPKPSFIPPPRCDPVRGAMSNYDFQVQSEIDGVSRIGEHGKKFATVLEAAAVCIRGAVANTLRDEEKANLNRDAAQRDIGMKLAKSLAAAWQTCARDRHLRRWIACCKTTGAPRPGAGRARTGLRRLAGTGRGGAGSFSVAPRASGQPGAAEAFEIELAVTVLFDWHLLCHPGERDIGLGAAQLVQGGGGGFGLARHRGGGGEDAVDANKVAALPEAFARQPHRFIVIASDEMCVGGDAAIDRGAGIARAQSQSA